jgi:hypothetical protein
MDVQIQRPAEPLNDGDGTTAPVRDSVVLCAPAQKPEDGAHLHSGYRATQIVIPRQHVAQPIGQAQHPLADRHVGEPSVLPLVRARYEAQARGRTSQSRQEREIGRVETHGAGRAIAAEDQCACIVAEQGPRHAAEVREGRRDALAPIVPALIQKRLDEEAA